MTSAIFIEVSVFLYWMRSKKWLACFSGLLDFRIITNSKEAHFTVYLLFTGVSKAERKKKTPVPSIGKACVTWSLICPLTLQMFSSFQKVISLKKPFSLDSHSWKWNARSCFLWILFLSWRIYEISWSFLVKFDLRIFIVKVELFSRLLFLLRVNFIKFRKILQTWMGFYVLSLLNLKRLRKMRQKIPTCFNFFNLQQHFHCTPPLALILTVFYLTSLCKLFTRLTHEWDYAHFLW